MPDIPPEALAAAEAAIACDDPSSTDAWYARAALEGAASALGDAVAAKILRHSDEHEPKPGSPQYLAWHRHFAIAARVAAGAFLTGDDKDQMAVEAIVRGDYVACEIPEP